MRPLASRREHQAHLAAQLGGVDGLLERSSQATKRDMRALLSRRQGDVQVPRGHGGELGRALELHGVAHAAHADALDRQMALVTLALRVGDVQRVGEIALGCMPANDGVRRT